ncbi:aromatic ring-hydroxylating dioxygenase subunit alpha [Pusillimonas caeni]|uniref:aromatic ring-hydroxylating dioxygenase subunit alpha n=1 Tax=Pusillimonas caeni TaxID=1348472 RepID=UPI000E59DDFD|nr:aromatic ring-hydroxylating dioxygenase subunit alpha [Pusillimonas caeni]TFL15569.1 aromatic ring-hydroxylating dioxygenase subunit alpha [Pusillimonas caeni]
MQQNKASAPFSAYHLREERLDAVPEYAQVGPGTPGGEYLRRFWHPIEVSAELGDIPKRIRILGEDLVLFRAKSGELGLVRPHCPHRGASLEFGIPDEKGIRCCYHGWLIGVDGTVLETPAEPETKNLRHGAYPVREFEGLIFAYMGPPEQMPPLPVFDVIANRKPTDRLYPGGWTPGGKYEWPCNWVQVKENAMDPVHTAYLHTIASGSQFTPEFGILPELEYRETPIGMVYVAGRRIGGNMWIRMHDLIMPNIHLVASVNETGKQEKRYGGPYLLHWATPIDDTSFRELGWLIETDDMKFTDEIVQQLHFGMMDDRPMEERQRTPGDYDAQVSQGAVHLRAREHLGTSDRGVAMFRRMLRVGIDDVRKGKDPKGLHRDEGQVIRTYTQNAVVACPASNDPAEEKRQFSELSQRVFDGEFRD